MSQKIGCQNVQTPIVPRPDLHYSSDQNSINNALKNASLGLNEVGSNNYQTDVHLNKGDNSIDNRRNQKNDEYLMTKSSTGQTLNDYLTSGQLDMVFSPVESKDKQILVKIVPTKPLVPKVPIEPSKTAELDPVLKLLQSDVSQLDEFRSSFRETRVRNQKTLNVPLVMASPSDHKFSHETSTLSTKIKQDTQSLEVDDVQRDLNSQIHNLIDIEFKSTAKKTGTLEKLTIEAMDNTLQDTTAINEPLKDEKDLSLLRARQHQFRWSERQRRLKPYESLRSGISPPLTKTFETTEVKEHEIVPRFNEPTKPEDSRSHHRTPPSRILSMLIPHMRNGVPIWIFSAGQLNVLRRMAQTQITLTHEQVCPSNRLVKWKIRRNKNVSIKTLASSAKTTTTAVESDDSRSDPIKSPVSVVLGQQTDSCAVGSKPSPIHLMVTNIDDENSFEVNSTPASTTSGATFWPEMKKAGSSSSSVVATNAFGASRSFSGPLFGKSLIFWQHRVGYPFPPCICNILAYLQQAEHAAHGIFRRPGGKSRVQALREQMENDIYWNSFDDWQPYDVADLLKQFLRELPECLLTNKLSSTLINIFHHAPEACTIELLRLAMISLPDENRIALQSLLHFLYTLSLRCSLTEMSAVNLSICLAPSLFRFSCFLAPSTPVSPLLANFGSRRRKKIDLLGGLESKDLAEQSAAQKCLQTLITFVPNIFVVTENIVLKTSLDNDQIKTPRLSSLLSSAGGDAQIWLQQEVETLIRDCGASISPVSSPVAKSDSNNNVGGLSKGSVAKNNWCSLSKEAFKEYLTDSGEGEILDGFEIFVNKLTKTSQQQQQYATGSTSPLLHTWRCSLLFPQEDPLLIAEKYWNERVSWDENVLRSEVMVDLVPDRVQINRILFNALPPQPARESRLLRGRHVLTKTKHLESATKECVVGVAIVSTSVNHGVVVPEVPQELLPSAHFSKEHLLVESVTDQAKLACRVTLISEADIKGFSQEWYTNQWGHYLLRRLLALRHSFAHHTEPFQPPDVASPPPSSFTAE